MKTMERTEQIVEVPCDRIRPMPGQPRRWFDPAEIERLGESLKAEGQLVPIRVVEDARRPGHYVIVGGERRWRAAQAAGLGTVKVVVGPPADPEKLFLDATTENIARANLLPLEIAEALRRLNRPEDGTKGLTLDEIATRFGKSHAWVTQHLSLLKLTADIQKLLHPAAEPDQKVAYSTALVIARYPPEEQWAALEKIRSRGGSYADAVAVERGREAKKRYESHQRVSRREGWLRRLGRILDEFEGEPPKRFAENVRGHNKKDAWEVITKLDRVVAAFEERRKALAEAAK